MSHAQSLAEWLSYSRINLTQREVQAGVLGGMFFVYSHLDFSDHDHPSHLKLAIFLLCS